LESLNPPGRLSSTLPRNTGPDLLGCSSEWGLATKEFWLYLAIMVVVGVACLSIPLA